MKRSNPFKLEPDAKKYKLSCSIEELPMELYAHVFQFIDDVKTLLTLERTCKSFHAICQSHVVWKRCICQNFDSQIGFNYEYLQKYLGELKPKEQYRIESQLGVEIDNVRFYIDFESMIREAIFESSSDEEIPEDLRQKSSKTEETILYAQNDLKNIYLHGKYATLQALLFSGHLCEMENYIYDAACAIDYWGRDLHLWEGLGGDACGYDDVMSVCLDFLRNNIIIENGIVSLAPIFKVSWETVKQQFLSSLARLVDSSGDEYEKCKKLSSYAETLKEDHEYAIQEWGIELFEDRPELASPFTLTWLLEE